MLAYTLVFGAALAVYWPTFGYEFLNWDDQIYVLENPWIREISLRSLKHIFTESYSSNFLPLHLLSYMLDYQLWGLNPMGYHLTSVLLHALVSAISLGVTLRLTGSLAVALLASLFFAVHPSHVEAVAWVSSRKDLLSMLFLLLSLCAYLRAREGRTVRWGSYWLSVLFFSLGLLSKVTIAAFPAFLLLLDLAPAPKSACTGSPTLRFSIATKLPFAVVALLLAVINSRVQVTAAAPYAEEPLRYSLVKGHAVWNYLALLAGVRGGTPIYDLPRFGDTPLEIALNAAGLALLPAVAIWFWRRRQRQELLGVSWLMVFLVPAVVFPVVTYMADRYLYAPSLGFCWLLAMTISAAAGGRRSLAWRPQLVVAALASAVVIAGFAVRTASYIGVWRNSETLWSFAMKKSRDSRIYVNLADTRMQQGRWAEAEELLKQAAGADSMAAHRSLGVLYNNLGRYEEALAETDRALGIQSRKRLAPAVNAELHYNKGVILWSLGRADEAVREWRTTLEEQPENAGAKKWLERAGAAALKRQGAPRP